MKSSEVIKFISSDIFAPWVAYPVIYILYFYFGSLKCTIYPTPSTKSLLLAFAGLAFYMAGIFLSYKLFNSRLFFYTSSHFNNKFDHIVKLFVLVFFVISIIGIIIQTFWYGIPILNPSIRGGTSLEVRPNAKLFALMGLFPLCLNLFLVTYLNYLKNIKLWWVIFLIIGLSGTMFSGYRTNVVIFLITFLLLINYCYKKINLCLIAIYGIFLAMIIFIVQKYRLIRISGWENYNNYLSYINPRGYPDFLVHLNLVCREGAVVFSDIVNMSPIHGLFHGRFFEITIATILPGVQIGPRNVISLIRETGLQSSTTPSILGGPYLDFGIFGIFVGMFLIGFIINFLYISIKNCSENPLKRGINVLSYSYIFSIFVLSIHTGFLDVSVYMTIFFVLSLQIVINGWFSNQYVVAIYITIIFIVAFTLMHAAIHPSMSLEDKSAFIFCKNNIKLANIYIDKSTAIKGITYIDTKFLPEYYVKSPKYIYKSKDSGLFERSEDFIKLVNYKIIYDNDKSYIISKDC